MFPYRSILRHGNIDVVAQKEVVDKVTIPEEEITLEDARELNLTAKSANGLISSSPLKISAVSPRKRHDKSSLKNFAAQNEM